MAPKPPPTRYTSRAASLANRGGRGGRATNAQLPRTQMQYPNRQAFERNEARTRAMQTPTSPLAGGEYGMRLADFLANTPGEVLGATTGGSNGGGGRGGGGGYGGPNPAQVRGWADELFKMNTGPYDMMRQQAQGYNPDFAAMEQQYAGRVRGYDTERAAAVKARLNELAGFGRTLATEAGAGQATALRDLGNQGANAQRYMQMTAQANADRTGMLANQGQYMGQLNAQGAQGLASALQAGSLVRQGGEATLANNRGQLLNQITLQQAQQQQALDQARREFMLKYGVA